MIMMGVIAANMHWKSMKIDAGMAGATSMGSMPTLRSRALSASEKASERSNGGKREMEGRNRREVKVLVYVNPPLEIARSIRHQPKLPINDELVLE